MNLTSPESLIFWTTLVFIVFFMLMKKDLSINGLEAGVRYTGNILRG